MYVTLAFMRKCHFEAIFCELERANSERCYASLIDSVSIFGLESLAHSQ